HRGQLRPHLRRRPHEGLDALGSRHPAARRALAARRSRRRSPVRYPHSTLHRKDPMLRALASVVAALLLAMAGVAYSQQSDFKPYVGQQGKDVVWVPTPDEVVDRMLTMAQVKPEDFVIDLGAGDGKIAIAAAKKFGAKSMGVEYNPDMVAFAQKNAQAAGVVGKAQIVHGDIFATDFTQATVLTMYLLPSL